MRQTPPFRSVIVRGSIALAYRFTIRMPTIFTRIIAGEIPGNFIFRDEHWCSLLDIRPSSLGHALLIPRYEAAFCADLPSETLASIGSYLVRLTSIIKRVSGCPAVNLLLNDGPLAGQEVPHVHWHVIPRWADDQLGYRFSPKPGSGLGELAARLSTAWVESA